MSSMSESARRRPIRYFPFAYAAHRIFSALLLVIVPSSLYPARDDHPDILRWYETGFSRGLLFSPWTRLPHSFKPVAHLHRRKDAEHALLKSYDSSIFFFFFFLPYWCVRILPAARPNLRKSGSSSLRFSQLALVSRRPSVGRPIPQSW